MCVQSSLNRRSGFENNTGLSFPRLVGVCVSVFCWGYFTQAGLGAPGDLLAVPGALGGRDRSAGEERGTQGLLYTLLNAECRDTGHKNLTDLDSRPGRCNR